MKRTLIPAIFVSFLLALTLALASGTAFAGEMHNGGNSPTGNGAPGGNPSALHNDDNGPPPGYTGNGGNGDNTGYGGCLGDKYRTVKKTIYAPGDRHKYGETYERGYRTTSTYGNTHNIPAGYWVYCAPYWYVYGEKAGTNPPPTSHPQGNPGNDHGNGHDNGPDSPPHNPPGH